MTTKRGPAYRVETERLVIRCWEPEDAALLKSAIDASLDHLREWMPWANDEPESVEQKTARLRLFRGRFDLDQDYVYAIFNREETAVLGGSGLHTRIGDDALEIGYWIHADHINKGYATEASLALTKVAFEINGVQRVEIHCSPKNLASASVPRKLAFTHEATLPKRGPAKNGVPVDSMIWALHADEYPGSPASSANLSAYGALGERLL
ncbi:GNAT family N-acetyltransferase [Candidatus Bipolaricaulota bacterium]|nr:GNAT family N-acetyltransferase [Candidatus Bipolaricaulota bacterium]